MYLLPGRFGLRVGPMSTPGMEGFGLRVRIPRCWVPYPWGLHGMTPRFGVRLSRKVEDILHLGKPIHGQEH